MKVFPVQASLRQGIEEGCESAVSGSRADEIASERLVAGNPRALMGMGRALSLAARGFKQVFQPGGGTRVSKYGVAEDTCSGVHSCIRLSGCPTLSIKAGSDPLKVDPVATVLDGCVGCGLCGENAHAATLCPSFYRAEVIHNPGWRDRIAAGVRGAVLRWVQPT